MYFQFDKLHLDFVRLRLYCSKSNTAKNAQYQMT